MIKNTNFHKLYPMVFSQLIKNISSFITRDKGSILPKLSPYWFIMICRNLFSFYVYSSIHVAVNATALGALTYLTLGLPFDIVSLLFIFFSTLCTYNFIKYHNLYLSQKTFFFKNTIRLLSICSACIACYLFFKLFFITQLLALLIGGICFLYACPITTHYPNLRNIAGIKIYIVALCWVATTIGIPLFQSETTITKHIGIWCLQLYLFVINLLLIFEIKDSAFDLPSLQTVPQKIGITNTKRLIYFFLLCIVGLSYFQKESPNNSLFSLIIVCVIIALFTMFVTPKRTKFYTLFWVELIPTLWLSILLITEKT